MTSDTHYHLWFSGGGADSQVVGQTCLTCVCSSGVGYHHKWLSMEDWSQFDHVIGEYEHPSNTLSTGNLIILGFRIDNQYCFILVNGDLFIVYELSLQMNNFA
jgi:hypothetical protein